MTPHPHRDPAAPPWSDHGPAGPPSTGRHLDLSPLAREGWTRDILLGFGVLVLAFVELDRAVADLYVRSPVVFVVAVLLAGAVACHRRAPGAALLLGWMMLFAQMITGTQLFLVQLAGVLALYGAARYGSTPVVWVSGVSVLGAVAFAVILSYTHGLHMLGAYTYGVWLPRLLDARGAVTLLLLTALAICALPWLVGLVLRLRAAARASREKSVEDEEARRRAEAQRSAAEAQRSQAEAQRSEAQEIARLREGQARLARDVHDVVGHSLAVILAQAESAQFLPDEDTEGRRRTMENIASSARQSLRDVRQVLASIAGPDGPGLQPTGSPDTLIEDVRAAGGEVRDHVIGAPRPLPSDVGTVAFRVLQEMLTNALKHGVRGEPVLVERHWDEQLRIEVRNAVSPRTAAGVSGMGLEGMRARLDTVGGRLSVARHPGHAADEETADDPATVWAPADGGRRPDSYTATAWIPLPEAGPRA